MDKLVDIVENPDRTELSQTNAANNMGNIDAELEQVLSRQRATIKS